LTAAEQMGAPRRRPAGRSGGKGRSAVAVRRERWIGADAGARVRGLDDERRGAHLPPAPHRWAVVLALILAPACGDRIPYGGGDATAIDLTAVAEAAGGDGALADVAKTDADADAAALDGDGAAPPPCSADDQCPGTTTPCVLARCLAPHGGGQPRCAFVLAKDGAACDDGDPCTAEESCQGGACVGGSPACGCQGDGDCGDDGDLCNGKLYCDRSGPKGVCKPNPKTVVACPPSTACVQSLCNPATGNCDKLSIAGSCDDGNPCTANDACAGGACKGGAAICACLSDADCPDDGDLCNGLPQCDQATFPYLCKPNAKGKVSCPAPPSPCLLSVCASATGACALAPAATSSACDDQNPCTTADVCQGGACAGKPAACDDGNPCTADACDAANGACTSKPAAAACSDGDACTFADACQGGACVGKPVACDDGNPCTDDGCTKAKGCGATPNGAACNDGNPCTAADTCAGAVCAGAAKVCDDKNPCTQDTCAAASGGCVFVPTAGACSDANACTSKDTCVAGACHGAPAVCDDGKPCTADGCDPAKGCFAANLPDGKPCDDGNTCTTGDACAAGLCKAIGAPCDDNNVCTADTCVPAKGCQSAPADGKACDDGSACTAPDVCAAGKCQGAPACDDNNPCTSDACTGGKCSHAANSAGCDDGNACTGPDGCAGGTCQGAAVACPALCGLANTCDPLKGCKTTSQLCDDGNPCTADGCVNGVGCVQIHAADNTACGAGQVCKSGVCGGCATLQVTIGEPGFDVTLRGVARNTAGNFLVVGTRAKTAVGAIEDGFYAIVSATGAVAAKFAVGDLFGDALMAAAAGVDGQAASWFAVGAWGDPPPGKDRQGWAIALKADGAPLWDKRWGGQGDDELTAVAVRGSSLLAVGSALDKAWVAEIDPAGGAVLSETFASIAPGKNQFRALAVVASSSPAAYAAGVATDGLGATRAILASIGSSNNLGWAKTFGTGSPSSAFEALATVDTAAGVRLAAAGWHTDGSAHTPWIVVVHPLTGAVESERTESTALPRSYQAVAATSSGVLAAFGVQGIQLGKVLLPQFGWFANWPPLTGAVNTAHPVALSSNPQALRGAIATGAFFTAVGHARFPSATETSGWLVQLGAAGKPACLP